MNHTHLKNKKSDNILIFVHGLACSSKDWKYQILHFKNYFEILYIDIAILKQLDIIKIANYILNILTTLKIIKNIHLIGHSMGCRVCLQLYTTLTIKSITLIDCGYSNIILNDAISKVNIDEFFYNKLKECPKYIKTEITNTLNTFDKDDIKDLFINILIYDYYSINIIIKTLNIPILIIQNDNDKSKDWLNLLYDKASIKLIKNSSHWIQLQKKCITNKCIKIFLNKIK